MEPLGQRERLHRWYADTLWLWYPFYKCVSRGVYVCSVRCMMERDISTLLQKWCLSVCEASGENKLNTCRDKDVVTYTSKHIKNTSKFHLQVSTNIIFDTVSPLCSLSSFEHVACLISYLFSCLLEFRSKNFYPTVSLTTWCKEANKHWIEEKSRHEWISFRVWMCPTWGKSIRLKM